jgi:hypothetical protein
MIGVLMTTYINATSTRECMFGIKFASECCWKWLNASIETAGNQRLVVQVAEMKELLEMRRFRLIT